MSKIKRAFFNGGEHVSGKTWSICNIFVGEMEHLTHFSGEMEHFNALRKSGGF